jgi:hypothetical protein
LYLSEAGYAFCKDCLKKRQEAEEYHQRMEYEKSIRDTKRSKLEDCKTFEGLKAWVMEYCLE